MAKELVTEKKLLAMINSAIDEVWDDENHHCLVSNLREVHGLTANWEVDVTHTGGADFSRTDACHETIQLVLPKLLHAYDVEWSLSQG